MEFSLTTGQVTARVQGSRPRPYKVTIAVLPLTTAQWRSVESRLAAQALFRARLLAGDMPPEIEQVFADCGTPLFPRSARDLTMSCSCPDWEVPCKHLAAVCYVLAEAFDADPFTVLAWRGKARDDLLAALRGKTAVDARGVGAERPAAPGSLALAVLADVTAPPLEKTLAGFWSPGLSQARLRTLPPSPATPPDLLLRMSDRLDVQVRGTDLKELLAPAYDQLGPSSLRFLSGGAMHSFGVGPRVTCPRGCSSPASQPVSAPSQTSSAVSIRLGGFRRLQRELHSPHAYISRNVGLACFGWGGRVGWCETRCRHQTPRR